MPLETSDQEIAIPVYLMHHIIELVHKDRKCLQEVVLHKYQKYTLIGKYINDMYVKYPKNALGIFSLIKNRPNVYISSQKSN